MNRMIRKTHRVLMGIMVNLLLAIPSLAQDKALAIGDTLPAMRLDKVINFASTSVELADFKEKLIILDFWATWCTNCIAAFPKMDSLQRLFKDDLIILPVTNQKEEVVRSFWKTNRLTKGISLPSVVEDSVLHLAFPHTGVPHEVWIDGEGVVKAITNGEYVTAENIQAVLDGKKTNWIVQVPRNKTFSVDQSLIAPSKNGMYDYGILNYSVLTKHIKGVSRKYGIKVDTLERTKRFYAINNSIIDLCNIIMRYRLGNYTKNRILFEASDSSRYYYDKTVYKDQWLYDNTYCYETVLPVSASQADAAEIILQDLNKFLGIKCYIKKETTMCWVLRKNDQLKSNGPNTVGTQRQAILFFRDIINTLNSETSNPPVIDETGLDPQIRLDIQVDSWTDLPHIQKALKKQGLELIPMERQVEMLVIGDPLGK